MLTTPREQSLSEQAYQYIQRRLLDGALRAGQILSEQVVADELGISRTPVREAIGRLEAEGLVTRVARAGTIIRAPDYRDLRELYEVREALESLAACAAASHLSSGDGELLERACHEMAQVADEMRRSDVDYLIGTPLRRYLDADITFHMVIVRGLNNRRCMKIISEFRVIQRIYEFHRVVHTPRLVELARQQHARILTAIREHDSEEAATAMADHIRCCRQDALAAYDGVPTERPDDVRLELPHDLLARLAPLS